MNPESNRPSTAPPESVSFQAKGSDRPAIDTAQGPARTYTTVIAFAEVSRYISGKPIHRPKTLRKPK